MVAVAPLVLELPPLGEATVQLTLLNCHPVGVFSVIVYVWKFVMLLKVVVAPVELLPSKLKFASGVGLAVNGNEAPDTVGVADLIIVMDPGNTTASAERLRS
jgi:hypothetical protein